MVESVIRMVASEPERSLMTLGDLTAILVWMISLRRPAPPGVPSIRVIHQNLYQN